MTMSSNGRRIAIGLIGLALSAALLGQGLDAAEAVNGFRIRGRVRGLRPGVDRTLVLRVHNPYLDAIVVRSIGVQARDASRSCRASNLTVSSFRGRVRVAPRTTERIRVPVVLSATAPPACLSARFPLSYTGRAVRA
jgi:hypothetical protein